MVGGICAEGYEKQMENEIEFTDVIKEEHQDNKVVDGIHFDLEQLFIYIIIQHFGLEEKARIGTNGRNHHN